MFRSSRTNASVAPRASPSSAISAAPTNSPPPARWLRCSPREPSSPIRCFSINALDEDADGELSVSAKRIGGPLLFGKIWERLGVADVLGDLLKDRAFEFAVERAVFVATPHRIFVSGSDRCGSWMEDYDIPGAAGLDLHHFYRAMAWLGEEMEEKSEDALAPCCVKDAIEEKLFDKRRDLFADLSAVFMDTTSLSFYGEGGETLGEHGYYKDYRPDLKQMILALIVDGAGRPTCTEMWPGNTADVTTLLPVIPRNRDGGARPAAASLSRSSGARRFRRNGPLRRAFQR